MSYVFLWYSSFDPDIQDKRFHALKSRWGISKFLPLESFRDAANGFVLTDCCVFGAEVFVRDGQIKKSILSILESKSDRSYTWRIDNFSDLNNNKLTSPVFSFGEWSWYVLCSALSYQYTYFCSF